MLFRQLFHSETSTYTYLLADPTTRQALLIDPVYENQDRDVRLLGELGLTLRYVLDTHAHADHITGANALRKRLGAETIVSRSSGVETADRLVSTGDVVLLGSIPVGVLETPGHTTGCASFIVRRAGRYLLFTGDALLIRGCGRTDFQQGDAACLYRSIHEQIYSLPDDTLIYPGHDYNGMTCSTVAEEKAYNPRLHCGVTQSHFMELMHNLELPMPKQMAVAVPANLAGGNWA